MPHVPWKGSVGIDSLSPAWSVIIASISWLETLSHQLQGQIKLINSEHWWSTLPLVAKNRTMNIFHHLALSFFLYGLGWDIMVTLQKAKGGIQRKCFSEVGRNSLAIVYSLTTQIPCGNFVFLKCSSLSLSLHVTSVIANNKQQKNHNRMSAFIWSLEEL